MAGWLGKNVLCVTGYDEEVAMWGGYGFGVRPRWGRCWTASWRVRARGANPGSGCAAAPVLGFGWDSGIELHRRVAPGGTDMPLLRS
jgi:hypothetical protein